MNSLLRKFLLLAPFVAPAFGNTVVFNVAPGNLGVSHDFTFGTATIHALAVNGGSLFGKAAGGDEDGLGLTGDPSGNTEIWVKASGTQDFIQLDLLDLITKGYTGFSFQMGSTTASEGWSVSACATTGVNCGTSAVTGTDEGLSHSAPGNLSATNRYLDFSATGPAGSNVLLHSLTATLPDSKVPEPASVALLGTVVVALLVGRRRLKLHF